MKKSIISIIILLTVMQAEDTICHPTKTTTMANGERIPSEISAPEDLRRSGYSIDYSAYGESLPSNLRTFDVTPKHEILSNNKGVKFTIEDVTPASASDLNMPKIIEKEYQMRSALGVNMFYRNMQKWRWNDPRCDKTMEELLPYIEVFSKMPDNLVYSDADGIIAACVVAFSKHLPLTLSPDHIWYLILHAVCIHIEQNSEELSSKFVNHESNKKLNINAPSLIKGKTPPSVWEREVFPQFSQVIKNNLASEEIHKLITSDFSDTTSIEHSCKEIMLMGVAQKYFNVNFKTMCGIPSITLLGSEKDWQSIIERTEALLEYVTPEFKDFWLPKLKPVLKKFLDAYRGDIDHTFWQTMVKLRRMKNGSSTYPFISGWIQILFPYLSTKKLNTDMQSWEVSYFVGLKASYFSHIITSVPATWQYYGSTFNMHYHSGIVGFSQNPEDGSLMPVSGWNISYDDIN